MRRTGESPSQKQTPKTDGVSFHYMANLRETHRRDRLDPKKTEQNQSTIRSKGMPRKPKKLCPWILKSLDDKTYENLNMQWDDRSKGDFWLPWPRQKKKGWQEEDSAIILGYVTMQKGYVIGDSKKFVEWKARFRTALTKDPFIHELKEEHKPGLRKYRLDFNFNNKCGSSSTDESSTSEASGSVGSPCSDASSSAESTGDFPPTDEEMNLILLEDSTVDDELNKIIQTTLCGDISEPGLEKVIVEQVDDLSENTQYENGNEVLFISSDDASYAFSDECTKIRLLQPYPIDENELISETYNLAKLSPEFTLEEGQR